MLPFTSKRRYRRAFAQGDAINMNEIMTASPNATGIESSPMSFDIPDNNIQVKLSWQPETINTDETTRFTFEFLDSSTGEHLKDVSYSVHMMLDGKSMVMVMKIPQRMELAPLSKSLIQWARCPLS